MSHELEILESGEASMAYAGEVPWHGLGVKVGDNVSTDEMLKAANLDWGVEVIPAYSEINGEKVALPSSPLVRSSDNRILSMVSNDWKPVQNKEAFDFFNDFVEAGQMTMETAGSLYDGERVWAMAKTTEIFELPNHDIVEGYLLFSNPHKYGNAIDVRFTSIRVVCNNTISIALSKNAKNGIKLNHRKEFDPAHVKQILGLSHIKMDQYKDAAEFLAKVTAKKEDVVDYFKKLFPATENQEEKHGASLNARRLQEALVEQPGADTMSPGTWWSAFNAVTYFVDHKIGRDQNSRLNSAWYGYGADKKIEALKMAVELAS